MNDPTRRAPEPDEPLEADEILVQRYCDGTLSEREAEALEARMEADPDFARRVDRTASFFALLDLQAAPAPERSFADAALEAWERPGGWIEFFGGLAPAVAGFLVLDALLGGLLVGLMVVRGPVEILKSWLLGLKDLLILAHDLAPSASQAVPVAAVSLVLCGALLVAVGVALRRVLRRVGARQGVGR